MSYTCRIFNPTTVGHMPRKNEPPSISDAEWTVMKVLWERHPLTSREVVDALATQTTWKPKTIHTLLSRLVKKRALAATKERREYQFEPVVREEDCQRHVAL